MSGGSAKTGRRRRRAWVPAAACALAVLATACSSEDVTGEPEEIEELVRVVAEGSECVEDSEAGDLIARVRLENRGEDERTVRVIVETADAGGTTTRFPLDSVEVTVPGGGGADGEAFIVPAPDDVAGCGVRIDGGEVVPIPLRRRAEGG